MGALDVRTKVRYTFPHTNIYVWTAHLPSQGSPAREMEGTVLSAAVYIAAVEIRWLIVAWLGSDNTGDKSQLPSSTLVLKE